MRRFHQKLAKSNAFAKAARLEKDPGVRYDSDNTAENLGRDAVA